MLPALVREWWSYRSIDGRDFGNIGQASRAEIEVIHSRFPPRLKHAVVAGLAKERLGIVLLSEHAKPSGETGHDQAGAEIVCRW